MKVSEAIAAARLLRSGENYTDNTLMGWLSTLDQELALQAGEGRDVSTLSRVSGQQAYDLPSGITWDMVENITVDGEPVQKLTAAAMIRRGAWLEDSKINLYPVPTVTDSTPGVRLGYQPLRAAYTVVTGDLYLPSPWSEAYKFYLAGQIYLYDRDQENYNNMILLYNSTMKTYWEYRSKTMPSEGLVVRNVW